MFLHLPILVKKSDTWHNSEAAFNPALIVSIEPDLEDSSACIIVTADGTEWYSPITVQQVEKRVKAFIETNILHHYYNSLKNNNG